MWKKQFGLHQNFIPVEKVLFDYKNEELKKYIISPYKYNCFSACSVVIVY